MKKALLFGAMSLAVFAQCGNWETALVKTITGEIDRLTAIKEITVTGYPYPNVFEAGGEPPAAYGQEGWEEDGWETRFSLQVSAVNGMKETRILAPDEYTVGPLDTNLRASEPPQKKVAVTVKLNGKALETKFDVVVASLEIKYNTVSVDSGLLNGSIVPFPSSALEGDKVTVYVNPSAGWMLEENSISYQDTSSGISTFVGRNGDSGKFGFTMPVHNVKLTARFIETAAALFTSSASVVKNYATLKAAIESAESGDTVKVLKDISIDSEDSAIVVAGKELTIQAAGEDAKTIKRGGDFKGSLFTVESGKLSLSAGHSLGLVIDGGKLENMTAEAALITVRDELTMSGGVTLQNNDNAASGASGEPSGGAVFVDGGAFTMSGGLISGNKAGDPLNDNGNGGGGGVAIKNAGEFTMKDGSISGNEGQWGGGIWAEDGGRFAMENGSVSGNNAYDAGAVSIGGSGKFTMTGGILEHNTANNTGGGITLFGAAEFSISGGAVVAEDNDVYLPAGNSITVAGNLTAGGIAARITLPQSSYTDGVVVLSEANAYTVWKFAVNCGANDAWCIELDGNNGKLSSGVAAGMTTASGHKIYFPTLQHAVNAAEGTPGNPDTITLPKDEITLPSTIVVENGKHIRMVSGKYPSATIKRGTELKGSTFTSDSLFTVAQGASLTLEGGASGEELIIDGEIADGKKAKNTLISVAGNLTMNTGATVQNNDCETNSGLGGSGVFIYGNGCFTMNDGKISGNKVTQSGRNVSGAGVYVNDSGTFEMKGGEISGNQASYGAGVYVAKLSGYSSTFIKTGGTIYGFNADPGKNNVAQSNGHAVYVGGNPSKKRNATAGPGDNLDSSTDGGWD
jgi:hypothetical protein